MMAMGRAKASITAILPTTSNFPKSKKNGMQTADAAVYSSQSMSVCLAGAAALS